MNPGAGDSLKHLMGEVKSKASKEESPDLKAKALSLKPKGKEPKTLSLDDKGFNLKALGEAVEGANSKKQTIAIWGPKISAIMWYLKKTTPEFSISDEARIILEEGLERKYPELFQKVEEEMNSC